MFFSKKIFDNLILGPECFFEISRELWHQPCQLIFCVVYQVMKFILHMGKIFFLYIIPTCHLP